jgi:hypothetical protein
MVQKKLGHRMLTPRPELVGKFVWWEDVRGRGTCMSTASELIDLDVQIFRLQAQLVKQPQAQGTEKLEQLLKAREQLLLRMKAEETERLSNPKYKRP